MAVVALAFVVVLMPAWCRADTFQLRSGSVLEGRLLNPDERPRSTWRIALPEGGELTLPSRSITSFSPAKPNQVAYDQIVPKMPPTAEGNLTMARWCKQNDLPVPMAFHYENVLTFEPDNEEARRGLGYVLIEGAWYKPDEYMKSMGYVRHKGEWRLPMDVAIEEGRTSGHSHQSDWQRKIRGWVKSATTGDRKRDESLEAIRTLNDPGAASAVASVLRDESRPDVRRTLIATLGRTGGGVATLTKIAVEDPNGDFRDAAAEVLAARPQSGAVRTLTGYLNHKNNAYVNNAALVLGRIGDKQAIPDLIEALVTKHSVTIGSPSSSPAGAMPMSVGTGSGAGGGGIGMSQGSGSRQQTQMINNPHVFDALMALTDRAGASFGHNQDAWRQWYVRSNTPQGVNLLHRRE